MPISAKEIERDTKHLKLDLIHSFGASLASNC